ncbi:Pyrazinamidase/nicotinamidase [Zalerion maritima]|uniref:nicotinamidase n=1 Tax=Zalerion maritima TaxID=339359 RepID=A0AAD5RMB3_9PEZI|nr:Pyrazinamidase/nicotinamidase [Zalerion maritima]
MRAILVVDMQEDFCPPNGSLAVEDGREITALINSLLPLFPVRLATQDWHPTDHVSFASNHAGKEPFVDFTTIINPENPEEKIETRLWPDHCVQGSPGAALIPELDTSLIQDYVKKGTHPQCETYSAFCSPFRKPRGFGDTGLARKLRDQGVDEVWVVGLAADYCVQSTAVDAAKEGFPTFIIEEGTKAVDPSEWEATGRMAVVEAGVKVVSIEGEEVKSIGWKQD